jgi:hypothetical protein
MRAIVIAIIFFLLVLQCSFVLRAKYFFDSSYIVRKYKLEELPLSIKPQSIITVGDSSTMTAVAPELMGSQWLNFSMSGASFYEDYILVKRLIAQNRLPRTIILSHHLKLMINSESCFRDITLGTNLFSTKELLEIFLLQNLETYYVPSKFLKKFTMYPLFELFLAKLYLLPEQVEYFKTAFMQNRLRDNEASLKFIRKNRGHFFAEDLKGYPIANVGSVFENRFEVPRVSEYFLNKLLSELNQRKVKVVFVHPPYTLYYKKLFGISSILQVEKLFFQKYEKKYPLFEYREQILYLSNDHFRDLGHASEEGAKVYSQWLKSQFREFDSGK